MAENLSILTIPDPRFRERAKKVTHFDNELQKISQRMVQMMRQNDGVGLAAIQIGLPIRMITLEFSADKDNKDRQEEKPFPLTILVNPTVTKYSREQTEMEEGCLSLPQLELLVKRPKEVHVSGYDVTGKKVKIRAKGLLARVLQHEIDHLDGKLFTDIAQGVDNLDNYRALRLAFLGTPEFAVPTLEALVMAGLPIVGVITETDKPVGRKQQLTPPPVKVAADEFGLPVFQPENNKELTNILQQLAPNYVVVVAYGRILPKEAFDIAPYGILNVHFSTLPQYRGAAPVQAALLAGETEIGVTIMKMAAKLDAGPIVAQKKYPVKNDDTAGALYERLSIEGARLLIKTLPGYLSNQIQPKEQDDSEATHTRLIKKEDGLIDWKKESAQEIERKIRAYNPWPGAYGILTGDGSENREQRTEDRRLTTNNKTQKRLIIHKAHVKNGRLVPEIVQLEGKNPTNWQDFLRGFKGELPKNLENNN